MFRFLLVNSNTSVLKLFKDGLNVLNGVYDLNNVSIINNDIYYNIVQHFQTCYNIKKLNVRIRCWTVEYYFHLLC